MLLRKDDLDRLNVVGVGDRVVQNADSTDNLANCLCFLKISNVGGVANNEGSLGDTVTGLDTDDFAAFEEDLVNWGVEHVGTAVDSAETREGFGETTETVHWVEERRKAVLAHRVSVKF